MRGVSIYFFSGEGEVIDGKRRASIEPGKAGRNTIDAGASCVRWKALIIG